MNTIDILDNGELALFIEKLRLASYDISTTEFLTAQDLIVALAAQGTLPKTLAPMRTLLMPLLCHSPREQEDFNRHFDDWVNRLESVEPEKTPLTFLQSVWQETKQAIKNLKGFLIFASLALILLSVLPTFFDVEEPIEKKPTPETPLQPVEITLTVTDALGSSVTSTTHVMIVPNVLETKKSIENQPNNQQSWLWIILLLVALLCGWLFWYLWQRYKAQPYLMRKSTAKPPKITQLFAKNIKAGLFQSVGLARVAQQLRKHTPIATDCLDLKATIKRTIKAGGWFTPVTGYAKTMPEYLVLIDRTTFKDHQSHFIDAFVNQLIAQGVFVARYYFDGDPRHCYPENDELPPQLLTELADHYPSHRLLMFSEGNGFIDPMTGDIVRWIAQFSVWTQKTFFTLAQPRQWGYQEKLLEQADFLIRTVPVNENDLMTLAEQIKAEIGQPDNLNPKHSTKDATVFPAYFNEFSHWWLERHAPARAKITELLKQVRDFLGEDGYYWFSACAVYPELRWQLTLYLGYNLKATDGKPLLTNDNLAKLARLPWFRYGYMPNWLRKQLVDELPLSQEDKIRTALKTLLDEASDKPISDFQLEIADSPKRTFSIKEMFSALRQRFSSQWKTQTPKKSLRDYVFLSFMENRLAVRAPKELHILLFEYPKKWISNLKNKINYEFTKRIFDIVVSATALWFLSPLFLTVVLFIRLDSKGPVVFSQTRVGKNGRLFKMWKFRST